MNSLEKLHHALRGTLGFEPADEGTARLMQMLQLAGPLVGDVVPSDPAEFDAMLTGVAVWALSLRSDDADQLTIVAAEEPA
jgi:hypothetical protein